jgi:hypothetical protein
MQGKHNRSPARNSNPLAPLKQAKPRVASQHFALAAVMCRHRPSKDADNNMTKQQETSLKWVNMNPAKIVS